MLHSVYAEASRYFIYDKDFEWLLSHVSLELVLYEVLT